MPYWLLALVLVLPLQAQAVTTYHYDFQDGQTRGTKTSMAVPTQMIHDADGNWYMRITASPTDCSSIPADLCPPRSRSTVRFGDSYSTMPTITTSNMRQSYEASIRFGPQSTTRGSVIELFQYAPGGESYGERNGTGPVVRVWAQKTATTAATTTFLSLYNNELSETWAARTLSANTWYHIRIDAVWSHDPAVGRLEFFLDGTRVLLVTGRDVNLGPESSRIPEVKLGLYGDDIVAGAYLDIDNIKAYPTDVGPPNPPGTGTTPPPATASSIAFNYDFEDGQLRGDPTSMQVPPQLLTEGSNHYMRITGTPGDCDSIPADQCPPRIRATVRYTPAASSMPLITTDNMRQTYSGDMRFHQNGGNSVFSLFQDGPGGETYGELNATGPTFRFWRTNGTVEARASFDYERQIEVVAWAVPNNEWHNYKVVAIWSHDPAVGRIEVYYDNQLKMLVSGRDPNLAPETNRIPNLTSGLYSNNAEGVVDFDNIQVYPSTSSPPAPPGSGTTPPPTTAKTVYISTTGTGTVCTSAVPCSFTTGMAFANGGDTIKLGNGTHPACDGCLKSGTLTQPTVLESWNLSPTPVAVGADKLLVYPGLATLSTSTGITLNLPPGSHDITVRHLNVTTTGTSTNAALQVNTSTGTDTGPLLFENIEVQAPTRTGATSAAYIRGPNTSHDVLVRLSRFHRAGPTVNVEASGSLIPNGLSVIGPRHRIEDSDFYDNYGVGFAAWPSADGRADSVIFQRNRVFGNGSDGIALGPSTDARLVGNEVFANGRNGITAGVTANRAMIYQNSLYANSLKTLTNYMGIYAAANTVGIVRNNISIGHPSYQYSLPATMACTDNLASGAIETSCSGMTLNAVATDVWVDPTNATLASRDFSLVPSTSVAIDNGTAAICTSTDAGANRCTPALTLAGFPGAAPDQGAHEAAAATLNTLVADWSLDSDFLDATAQNNDGTATSVTFDSTNTVEGAAAALFNSPTDRIVVPLRGVDLPRGLTIALSGRAETLGTLQYLFGHTASAPGYTHRIQIKKDTQDRLVIGLGDTREALITSALFATETWARIGLVIHPPTLAGGGSGLYDVYVEGARIGGGVYTGLSQLATTATIGNNAGVQSEGWGSAGTAQLDKVRIWNYPRTAAEMADDCDSYCVTPTIPETFEPNCGTIGDIAPNVIRCDILSGADPAVCSPLSNYQVTCAGVAQTETACTVTGTTNPQLRLTLAAPCLPQDDVILTIATLEEPFAITNLITPPTGAFDMLSGETSVNGLQVLVTLAAIPPATTCQTLSAFRVRDNCVAQPITGCSLETAGPVRLQLTRASPPANPTVSVDVTYFPTDERIGVTNRYDPTGLPPEEPSVTGLAQAQWRFRPVGRTDAVRYEGRPNQEGHTSSPGTIGARVALANTSGATVTGLGTALRCARALPGGAFSDFAPVTGGLATDPYNSLGVRYDPGTATNLADGTALATAALPLGSGLTDSGTYIYRRQSTAPASYTLLDDQQLEEEHALQVAPNVPLGSRYVCRLYSTFGQPLDAYAGPSGCTTATGGFVSGQVPCGAPFTVQTPAWQRR